MPSETAPSQQTVAAHSKTIIPNPSPAVPFPLYAEVALDVPVDKAFVYSIPPDIKIAPQVGSRAEVMLAGRRMTGIITALHNTMPPYCESFKDKIKNLRRVVDKVPLLPPHLLDLARWMAGYYLCAEGEVLCAMTPSGRREAQFSASEGIEGVSSVNVCLSREQQEAVDGITGVGATPANDGATARQVAYHYLYGPTGSGKTEVFLSVAERVMERGKGVIYLVPEIGLTPQVERAVRERFGNKSAVLHSALTGSERLRQWRRILRREARVVIGARSAVFAPVPDLGLIIIDEEHDAAYKSGNVPRYHARQVAMHRAQVLGIPLVMGSATPSVESWYAIKNGTFRCHTLTKRLAGGTMPAIQCVDLKTEGMETACFSRTLVNEVRQTLAAKRQAILFLNRRGFTHFFRCMECGFELMCPNCSVPLTYHKSENRLCCHYCGHTAVPLQMCPKCGSFDIGYSGFGTEAVEAEARALFPNARIERADADSVSAKHTLEDTLEHFRAGECDILLGTQMVAKGLNFPGLQLVGVMLADTALHLPDFRAAERAFSLVTQVAGRAGRYFPDGRVIVQTYSVRAPAISYAVHSDTEGFYQWEIDQRRMTGFPPFSRMIHIVFRSTNEKDVNDASEEAAAILRTLSGASSTPMMVSQSSRFSTVEAYLGATAGVHREGTSSVAVLGPAECPLYKISRNYRKQILLRGKQIAPLQETAREMLYKIHKRPGVFIEIDVDPVSML